MRPRLWLVASAATVAACHPMPQPMAPDPVAPSIHRNVLRYNGIAGTDLSLPVYWPEGSPLAPESAVASDYDGSDVASRAIDGDAATAWSSADPKAATASLTVRFATPCVFRGIKIKTGPTAEATTYKLTASDDGQTWRPVSGRLVTLNWSLTPQETGGDGRWLRVTFYNSMRNPDARFRIYEFQAYGEAKPQTRSWSARL